MPDRNAEIAFGTKCRPRFYLARRDGLAFRATRLRDRQSRQKWICLLGGAWMDVSRRCSGVLEFQNSRSDPLQSSRRAIRFALYLQENRNGFGGETKTEIFDGKKFSFRGS
jgi:hypothetical protein